MEINPRKDCDNLGTIAYKCKYDIGDEILSDPVDWYSMQLGYDDGVQAFIALRHTVKHPYSNEFSGFLKERFDKIAISLPVYLYDHSGITVSTCPFSCPWDSGQVGIIYVLKEKVREEFSVDRISEQLEKKVIDILESEIKNLDQYLTSDYD